MKTSFLCCNTFLLWYLASSVPAVPIITSHPICNCLVCGKNENLTTIGSSTYITWRKLDDGMGTLALAVVDEAAFAHHKGFIYGGIVGNTKISHGLEDQLFLDFFFGNHDSLFVDSRLPEIENLSLRKFGKMKANDYYRLKESNDTWYHIEHPTPHAAQREWFTPEFLHLLRKGASCGINRGLGLLPRERMAPRSEDRVKVAIHMRLGDVQALMSKRQFTYRYKWVPPSLIIDVANAVKELCSNCDIHIFTTILSDKQLDMKAMDNISLGQIRNVTTNYTVHVDKEFTYHANTDAMNALAHMATADVLFTAKSGFSVMSGILNPNCVISFPYHHTTLPGWFQLPLYDYDKDYQDFRGITVNAVKEAWPGCMEIVRENKRSGITERYYNDSVVARSENYQVGGNILSQ